MKRFMSPAVRAILIVGMVAVIVACNGKQAESATAGQQTPASAEPATVAPEPVPAPVLAVASVKFGRYVEPKTFAIGGVGTKFKTSDKLFATVQLYGVADKASMQVRLLDSNNQVVAEESREVQPKQPMKVNFALTKAATAPVAAGAYTAETLLNGQVVDTTQITFE